MTLNTGHFPQGASWGSLSVSSVVSGSVTPPEYTRSGESIDEEEKRRLPMLFNAAELQAENEGEVGAAGPPRQRATRSNRLGLHETTRSETTRMLPPLNRFIGLVQPLLSLLHLFFNSLLHHLQPRSSKKPLL